MYFLICCALFCLVVTQFIRPVLKHWKYYIITNEHIYKYIDNDVVIISILLLLIIKNYLQCFNIFLQTFQYMRLHDV